MQDTLPCKAAVFVITALATSAAVGQDNGPYAQPDGSWVSLNGRLEKPRSTQFTLDYGGGAITVAMDGWSDYRKMHGELEGDRVTVYGKVGDALYENASIQASSMYVDSLNTYFYSDAMKNDPISPYLWSTTEPNNFMTIYGTVTSIDRGAGSFTIDEGARKVSVDTGDMIYSPLDDDGFQQISVGDFVSVNGRMNAKFIEGRVLGAADTTTLKASDSLRRESRPASR